MQTRTAFAEVACQRWVTLAPTLLVHKINSDHNTGITTAAIETFIDRPLLARADSR